MPVTPDQQDFIDARAEVVMKAQADTNPTLSYSTGSDPDPTKEVDLILIENRLATRWVAATAYKFNDRIIPNNTSGRRYRAIQAGTSGATEPTSTAWPVWTEGIITDGTVIWREDGIVPINIYDIRSAIYQCLNLKWTKAANQNQFIQDSRGQASDYTFLNLQRLIEQYRPIGVA